MLSHVTRHIISEVEEIYPGHFAVSDDESVVRDEIVAEVSLHDVLDDVVEPSLLRLKIFFLKPQLNSSEGFLLKKNKLNLNKFLYYNRKNTSYN